MQCALLIALSLCLALLCEMIPFLHLPFGGSFTVASMLPVILTGYLYGAGWGFGSAFCYAILQMLISFRTVSAFFLPQSDSYTESVWAALAICAIDYVLAYTVLGLGFAFRHMKNVTAGLVFGVLLATGARYLCHILSGAIFYGAWAEWFFSQEGFYAIGQDILSLFAGGWLAVVYSLIYNGLYMIPEILLTTVAAIPVSRLHFLKRQG